MIQSLFSRAASLGELPGHVRAGINADVLTTIGEEGVTLSIWQRAPAIAVGRLGRLEGCRVTATTKGVAAALDAAIAGPRPPWLVALIDDVAALAARFAAVVAPERGDALLDVRLDRLDGDGCRRFHADYVGVRLIATYAGRGTQWLAQDDRDAAAPFELAAGEVGLFKGRLLAGDGAIVHRSPPIAGTGEERLLLVIDLAAPLEAG